MKYDINNLCIGFVGKIGNMALLLVKKTYLDSSGYTIYECDDILNNTRAEFYNDENCCIGYDRTWGVKSFLDYAKMINPRYNVINEIDLKEGIELYNQIIPFYVKDKEIVECIFEQREYYIQQKQKIENSKNGNGISYYDEGYEAIFENGIQNLNKLITDFALKREEKYLKAPLWWWKQQEERNNIMKKDEGTER